MKSPWRMFAAAAWLALSATAPLPTAAIAQRPASDAASTAARAIGGLPLNTVADVALPGPANRFDYLSLDPRTHRLFVAHLAADRVVVFDVQARKVVTEIEGLRNVHGVLVVPELDRVYASATGTHEIAVIDARTLKVEARIPAGRYPDGIAYVPDVHKLYVSDETGGVLTAIEVPKNRVAATIPLGGEAGNTQYDAGSRHVFVNVQTRGQLVEIDPRNDTVVGRHPLPGANGNHGLLIDAAQRVAYIACEGNARLLVFDLDTKKVLSVDTVGATPDVLAFDPALRRLYVASESGVVSVFGQDGKRLHKRGEALLAPHAHSVAVDPETHLVYVPLQSLDGRPVLRILEPSDR